MWRINVGLQVMVVLFALSLSVNLSAHPLAPALLSVTQQADHQRYQIRWKTPLKTAPGNQMVPVMPASCQPLGQAESIRHATAIEARWVMACASTSIVGSQLGASNIASSGADVILRVSLADGRVFQQLLSPQQALFTLPEQPDVWQVMLSYGELGVEHLLGGIDHLLFVIGLMLLIGLGQQLLWTITAFTVGHSITLSLAVLGLVSLPQQLAEVFIALSLIVVAVELSGRSKTMWLKRSPWLAAGGFGLLHGLGFAGALSDIGLPQGEIAVALLSFNLGLELGQLAVIAVLALLMKATTGAADTIKRWRWLAVYSLGSLSALWFWERLLAF
ncbi:hypothetical protein SIN8267_03117 [Sinobacterium norvegicum]|uniref:HupE/UreJ family protein n=1 Tax=Sinobacterium norvegicum TaxID=1641715 RepID=A0ABN8EPT1_9GAMM|nr:HupE/UreJ family protein [Sinobacterium norvegicum]CAH0992978.1 hypothetical protein SIN8267_03117 [Sinobacterium norvegicum]